MNILLNSIIDENSQKFGIWVKYINEYINLWNSEVEFSDESYQKVTYNVVNAFSGISELCFKYGKFRDKWDNRHFYQHLHNPELIIKSLKTETEFFLGLDRKGIYLRTYWKQTQNLKNMGDEFWKQVLELSEFPGFEYKENAWVGINVKRKYPDLYQGYQGMVFRIFRKYFLDIAENNKIGSLGEFEIKWNSEVAFEEIVRQCCEVFQIFYKLNYSLWKIEDLKTKKDVKRKAKRDC